MLYMAKTSLVTYLQIASCTRSAILNTAMFRWDGVGPLTSISKQVSLKKSAIFPWFSSVMASDHTPINYYRAYSNNCCVHYLLALWLNARTYWQWAGPKLHSILSTHRLKGTCFLITESDKRMRLLTRLYGNNMYQDRYTVALQHMPHYPYQHCVL